MKRSYSITIWLMLLGSVATLNAIDPEWRCTFNINGRGCFLYRKGSMVSYDPHVITMHDLKNSSNPDAPFEGDGFLFIAHGGKSATEYYKSIGELLEPGGRKYCLQLAYYVWGRISTLSNTAISIASNSNPLNTTGHYGNKWLTYTDEIYYPGDLLIVFYDDKRNPGIDMAIDDVKIYKRQCACLSFPCKNGGTCNEDLNAGTWKCSCPAGIYGETCDILGEGSMECTFEEKIYTPGDCFFEPVGQVGNFMITKGEVSVENDGPSTGSGSTYYLSVDSNNIGTDGHASLSFNSFKGGCSTYSLRFDYFFYGTAFGTLIVHTNAIILWQNQGKGKAWHTTEIKVSVYEGIWLVIAYDISNIKYRRSSNYSGVALDNLRLNCVDSVSLDESTTLATTTSSQAKISTTPEISVTIPKMTVSFPEITTTIPKIAASINTIATYTEITTTTATTTTAAKTTTTKEIITATQTKTTTTTEAAATTATKTTTGRKMTQAERCIGFALRREKEAFGLNWI